MSRHLYNSTTGTLTLIASDIASSNNFVGTLAQWNALSASDKARFKTIDITDDYNGMSIDSTPTENSTNPVQSGGAKAYIDAALETKANASEVPLKTQFSNPNLLDNPWFTVNQRGQDNYGDITSTNDNHGYSVDRWQYRRGGISLVSNGLKVQANMSEASGKGYIVQSIEDYSNLLGKTVTFTMDLPEVSLVDSEFDESKETYGIAITVASSTSSYGITNTIYEKIGFRTAGKYSETFEIPSSITGDCLNVSIRFSRLRMDEIANNSYYIVRAVKLELGEVSTLSMDVAPNYGTELAKCQRYFIRVGKLYPVANRGKPLSYGISHNNNDVWFPFYLPTPMRCSPKMEKVEGDIRVTTISTSSGLIGTNADGSVVYSAIDHKENDPNIILIQAKASGLLTAGTMYKLTCANEGLLSYFDFSADL